MLPSIKSTNQQHAQRPRHKRDRWIIVIGVLKLLKAVLFVLLGVGALKLLHKDLVDILTRLAIDMRFDPESHFVNLVLEKVALIDAHRLRQISVAIFCYAALDVIEGTGLVLEKTWAEYLTLVLTASFLPWEIFEILRHVTWVKIILTIINMLVVVYLVYVVNMRARERAASSEVPPGEQTTKDIGSR
jgi:uncharacterized membrane protein (DUF2068 family)